MQSLRREFLANTESFELSASYEPSQIRLRLVDHRDGSVREGLYCDCSLPEEVKEECDSVGDLFEYLESKPVGDLQVNEEGIKFKVVRIKKERWYSLSLQTSENPFPLQRSPAESQEDRGRLLEEN